jgi:hypothetical protein
MIRFVLPRSIRAAGAALWLPLAVAVVSSCHKTSAAVLAAETSGTLIVNVNAPPNVKFPSITVTGPSGYDVTIAGTDTLIDLGAGDYTVTAGAVSSTDEVVSTVYTGVVTGNPVKVAIDDTSQISVGFLARPGTGGLWVVSSNGGSPIAAQYSAGELRTGQSAGISLRVTDAFAVIDASGNLWVASHSANTITEYVSANLAATGSPAAAVTITGAALSGPDGLAFDPSGNLWVANTTANTVVEYTAEQLTGGGAPAPAAVISGSGLSAPGRVSFDAYGNLWVPNRTTNTVVEYSVAQLASGGAPRIVVRSMGPMRWRSTLMATCGWRTCRTTPSRNTARASSSWVVRLHRRVSLALLAARPRSRLSPSTTRVISGQTARPPGNSSSSRRIK